MSDFGNIVYLVLRIGFMVVIPIIIIYFRIKKKIKTSFTIGAIITSLLLSLFTYNVKTNPVKHFYSHVNNDQFKKAKQSYKIVIQHGPEYVQQIDESKIYNKKLYKKIKSQVVAEYKAIIVKSLEKADYSNTDDCKKMEQNKDKYILIQNALLILRFSESIGASYPVLKKKIQKKIALGKKITSDYEKKCKNKS